MIILYLKLAFATAVVLAPGWLLARTLGVRSVSATLAWSLVTIFGALAVTFALGSTLTLTLMLLVVVVLAAVAVRIQRGWRPAEAVPGRAWALFWGAVVGLVIWVAAPSVQGDGLFHLARARKLLSLDALSLDRVSEFADGSLHPGYAFPLWHGFIALIAKVAGEDPERVVVHLPSILAPLAVVVAFEAGWALFRRTWAAGVTAGAQVAMICFAPGLGGAYVFLSLPATAARQLLVPAALALAFESVRSPSVGLVASTAAAGLALAVVHPTYAIFLWIPFVGFLATRALWERKDLRNGTLALVALVVPAALFLLWLRPIVNDTRSVSPDADELRRAFEQYRGQLVVHSDTSYNLAPEVFTRAGAVAIAALLLIPLAGLAARRRWAAYVVGGSLAVFAVMLLPFLFPVARRPRLDLAGAASGRVPSLRVRVRWWLRGAGQALRAVAHPARSGLRNVPPDRVSRRLRLRAQGSGAGVDRVALVAGAVVALSSGSKRRRPALETGAALAAAAFLTPVVGGGLLDWRPPPPPADRDVVVRARRCRASRCGAGHDRLLRSGDELPARGLRPCLRGLGAAGPCRGYGEERSVRACAGGSSISSNRRRLDPATRRCRVRDHRWHAFGSRARPADRLSGRAVHALSALIALAPAAAARRLDPEEVAGREIEVRERGKLHAVQEAAPR